MSMTKFKNPSDALLALAGLKALSAGYDVLRGLEFLQGADGKSVWLRCGEHMIEAELPAGVNVEEILQIDWFSPESPLERMLVEGHA
jgi:hypothetical protein